MTEPVVDGPPELPVAEPESEAQQQATRARRLSITGTAATVSAAASLLIAVSAMFTAAQSYGISQRIAREAVFSRQLSTCAELGTLASELQGRNRRALRAMINSSNPATAEQRDDVSDLFTEREQVGDRLISTLYTAELLFQGGFQRTALERIVRLETEYLNAQIGLHDDGRYSPEEVVRLRDTQAAQTDLVIRQMNGCRDYLHGVVSGAADVG